MSRALNLLLLCLLVGVLQSLLLGPGSVIEVHRLSLHVAEQHAQLESLRQRNDSLAAEVADLKSGLDAVEERARMELGMVRRDEVFVRLLP